jgi:hypothetical protein
MRAEGQGLCAADERGTIRQSGMNGERPMNGGPAGLNWAVLRCERDNLKLCCRLEKRMRVCIGTLRSGGGSYVAALATADRRQ